MKRKTSEMLQHKYENSQLEYDNYMDYYATDSNNEQNYSEQTSTYEYTNQQNGYENANNYNQVYYTTGEYFPKKIKIHRWEEAYLYDDSMDFENSEYFSLLNEYQNQQEQYQNQSEQTIDNNYTFSRK